MMTIRHVEADGRERIIQVDSVDRDRDGTLTFGTTEKITTGRVYIMNDSGKSVATYDFDKQQQKR